MSGLLSVRAAALPSVRRFLSAVVDDLQNGTSVIVLVPRGVRPRAVADAVADDIDHSFSRLRVLDVTRSPRVPSDPLHLARSMVYGPVDRPLSLTDLLALPDFPDIVLLDGLGSVPADTRVGWLRLVHRWSEVAVSARAAKRCAVCLIAPAEDLLHALPQDGPRLRAHWWWGFPSALELRLLSREVAEGSQVLDLWRESLVLGLAAGDLVLAEHLWKDCPDSIEALESSLRRYGAGLGFNRQTTLVDEPAVWRRPRDLGVSPDLAPPERVRADWTAGRIIGSVEYGLDVHPSVLACRGDRTRLEHALWRGQSQLLLPLADRVRLSFCLLLQQTFGADWPARVPVPPDEEGARQRLEADPLTAELGYLVTLLGWLKARRLERHLHGWEGVLDQARHIRNRIAHYRPVTYDELRAFWARLSPGIAA